MDLAPAALEASTASAWQEHGLDSLKVLHKRGVDIVPYGTLAAGLGASANGPANKRQMTGYADVAQEVAGASSDNLVMGEETIAMDSHKSVSPALQSGAQAPRANFSHPTLGSSGLAPTQLVRQAIQPGIRHCWEPQPTVASGVGSIQGSDSLTAESATKQLEAPHSSAALLAHNQVQQNACWPAMSFGGAMINGEGSFGDSSSVVNQDPTSDTPSMSKCVGEFASQNQPIDVMQINGGIQGHNIKLQHVSSTVSEDEGQLSRAIISSSPWGSISQKSDVALSTSTNLNRIVGGIEQPGGGGVGVASESTSALSPGEVETGVWSLATPTLSPQPWPPQYMLPTLPMRNPIEGTWFHAPPVQPHNTGHEGPAPTRAPPPPGHREGGSRQGSAPHGVGLPAAMLQSPAANSSNTSNATNIPQSGVKPKSTVNRKPYRCGRCGQRKNQHMCPFKHMMISIRTLGVQTTPPDPTLPDPREPPTWPTPNDGYPTIVPRPYVAVLDNHDEPTGRYNLEYCQVPEVLPLENGGCPNNARPSEVPAAGRRQGQDGARGEGRVNLSIAAWYGAEVGFASSLGRWAYPPQAGLGGPCLEHGQGDKLGNGGGRALPAPQPNEFSQQVVPSSGASPAPGDPWPVARSEGSHPRPHPHPSPHPSPHPHPHRHAPIQGQQLSAGAKVETGASGVLALPAKEDLDQRLAHLERVVSADRQAECEGTASWANIQGVCVGTLQQSGPVMNAVSCSGSVAAQAMGAFAVRAGESMRPNCQQDPLGESTATDVSQHKQVSRECRAEVL